MSEDWSVTLEFKPLEKRFTNIQKYVDYLNRKYPLGGAWEKEEWAIEENDWTKRWDSIYYPNRFLFLDKD